MKRESTGEKQLWVHDGLGAPVHDCAPVPGEGIGSDQAAHTSVQVMYFTLSFQKRPNPRSYDAAVAKALQHPPDHARSTPEIHHVSSSRRSPLGGLAAPL